MKKSKKIILIGIICLVMSFAVGGAYAYWAGVVNAPAEVTDDINIQIGEGATVNTVLLVNQGPMKSQVLVPVGQVGNSSVGAGQVPKDQISFSYEANWAGTGATGTTGNFTITLGQITIGGSSTHADLVNIFVGNTPGVNPLVSPHTLPNSIVIGTTYNFSLTITLDCPSSIAVYNEIFNKPIAIPLTFSIAVT